MYFKINIYMEYIYIYYMYFIHNIYIYNMCNLYPFSSRLLVVRDVVRLAHNAAPFIYIYIYIM